MPYDPMRSRRRRHAALWFVLLFSAVSGLAAIPAAAGDCPPAASGGADCPRGLSGQPSTPKCAQDPACDCHCPCDGLPCYCRSDFKTPCLYCPSQPGYRFNGRYLFATTRELGSSDISPGWAAALMPLTIIVDSACFPFALLVGAFG